jgi:hypothetical protein
MSGYCKSDITAFDVASTIFNQYLQNIYSTSSIIQSPSSSSFKMTTNQDNTDFTQTAIFDVGIFNNYLLCIYETNSYNIVAVDAVASDDNAAKRIDLVSSLFNLVLEGKVRANRITKDIFNNMAGMMTQRQFEIIYKYFEKYDI